jgi:Fe-S-cluster containining protein
MRDGCGRRILKWLARVNFRLTVGTQRTWRGLRGERPFVLAGACRRSAFCCEQPAVQVDRFVWYVPLARRLFLWWQREVNGFELVGSERDARVFRFRCTHFDWQTRSCDSYESRPGMCRDYPRVLLHQAHPQFFPLCGYRPLAPNADALRQAIEAYDLTPEQRQKLAKGLHLEP